MLWVRAFHIIAMVTWFAGLFYLPRLFVYHAMSSDAVSIERFKVMERKLYWGITTPGGVLTVVLGLILLVYGWPLYAEAAWMHAKLALVATLVAYHLYLGHLVRVFREDRNLRSHIYYRWLNEYPVLVLIGVVVLVEVQPF